MLTQEQNPPPKAVNIIRPSSPLFYYLKQRPSSTISQTKQHHYYSQQQLPLSKASDSHSDSDTFSDSTSSSSSSSSSSSFSSPSTFSTFSGGSGTSGNRLTTPSILNSTSFGFGFFQSQQNLTTANSPTTWFKSTAPQTPTTPLPTAPINSFMQPFSSRFFCGTTTDDSSYFSPRRPSDLHFSSGDQQDDDDDDFDSIDGDSDEDYSLDDDSIMDSGNESQDDDYDLPIKVVAKIKNGFIMNGRGEMVNKGMDDSWLDEARASRKIADLEIEKTSLLALNSALESKVAQQATKIAKLEKQLQVHEWPLSPVSDKDIDQDHPCFDKLLSPEPLIEEDMDNDPVFQRLRCMLMGLIEQAEEAVRLQTKSTGRVLTHYNGSSSTKETIMLDAPPLTLKHSTRITPYSSQGHRSQQRRSSPPQRRASEGLPSPSPSMAVSRKRTPKERSLSRLSSPAVLVSTSNHASSQVPRSTSPKPSTSFMRRSSRPSHSRKSQDLDSPKWHY